MPVVVTVRRANDMVARYLLIAITLGGLSLSGTYIRAGFRESRRERDFQIRRAEQVSNLPRRRQTKNHKMGTSGIAKPARLLETLAAVADGDG
jgi:hypothetical protein